MSLEHLVPEEGKYSEEKHNSPRRWECRGGGGGDRGANRGTPEGQRQSQFSNRTVVLDHDPKHKIKKYPRGQPDINNRQRRKPGGSTWLCSCPVLRGGERPSSGAGGHSDPLPEDGGRRWQHSGDTCQNRLSRATTVSPPWRSRDSTHPGRHVVRRAPPLCGLH